VRLEQSCWFLLPASLLPKQPGMPSDGRQDSPVQAERAGDPRPRTRDHRRCGVTLCLKIGLHGQSRDRLPASCMRVYPAGACGLIAPRSTPWTRLISCRDGAARPTASPIKYMHALPLYHTTGPPARAHCCSHAKHRWHAIRRAGSTFPHDCVPHAISLDNEG
jgi:hypothetical protein